MTQWYEKIEAADSVEILEEIRIAIFGKKGVLAAEFAKMKTAENDKKAQIAKDLNIAKGKLTALFN
ncbi:MAG: phenylalanine--tRNA ligase subunit alpha, partial [Helicobacteraceae bacterium]|nr:phenylalanine--tRNA ligase subunit alpha [Helicobacteraceae bacterium]